MDGKIVANAFEWKSLFTFSLTLLKIQLRFCYHNQWHGIFARFLLTRHTDRMKAELLLEFHLTLMRGILSSQRILSLPRFRTKPCERLSHDTVVLFILPQPKHHASTPNCGICTFSPGEGKFLPFWIEGWKFQRENQRFLVEMHPLPLFPKKNPPWMYLWVHPDIQHPEQNFPQILIDFPALERKGQQKTENFSV